MSKLILLPFPPISCPSPSPVLVPPCPPTKRYSPIAAATTTAARALETCIL